MMLVAGGWDMPCSVGITTKRKRENGMRSVERKEFASVCFRAENKLLYNLWLCFVLIRLLIIPGEEKLLVINKMRRKEKAFSIFAIASARPSNRFHSIATTRGRYIL